MASVTILSPEEIRNELQGGMIHPVYLLAGPDRHRSELLARWLRSKVVDAAMAGLNDEVLYADEVTPSEIAERASAYPMFCGRRFLWLRHAEKLPTGSAIEPLLGYLAQPAESSVLVLSSAKLDKRLKLTLRCAERGRVVEFAALSGRALRQQIQRQAKGHGLRLQSAAIEALIELIGEDLAEIDQELAKLALSLGDGEASLEEGAVRDLVARSRDTDAFSLADHLDLRRPNEALDLWFQMRERGTDVMSTAAILSWRLRQMAQMRARLDCGEDPREAARKLGMSPWQAQRLAPLLTSTSARKLDQALEAWRRADLRAKSTRLGAGLVYDLALLEWAMSGDS